MKNFGLLKTKIENVLLESYANDTFKNELKTFPFRLLHLPYKLVQYDKSVFYAKKLLKLGKRTQ
jgi:hypothetical protein